MKYKNIVIVLLALVLFGYVVIYIRYNSYGTSYNQTRIKLNIPTIGNNWIKDISIGTGEVNYTNPIQLKDNHVKKRILLNSLGSVESEADLYIIQTKSITLDAIYSYDTSIKWNITYYNTSSNTKTTLTRKQLLDTLTKYNIR